MGVKIFSVGISNYDNLGKISFCEGDAEEFANVVQSQLLASQPFTLINQAVTATSLPRKFKIFCDALEEKDTLYFFYAGHGCNYKNRPYLSTYDSEDRADSIEETWVSLDLLRDIASNSKAKKIIFFIDACQTSKKDKRTSMLDELDVREAIDIENENSYEIVFHSCSKGEEAISNSDLGHGVWTYYLIQAFSCTEIGKKAIDSKYDLRVNKLQEYLYLHVRDYYLSKGRAFAQKPRVVIDTGIDPILASYPPEVVEKYSAIPEKHLASITYKTIELKDVDDLPGFIKKPYNRKHTVPDSYGPRTSNFVKKIGNKIVLEIIEHAKENLIDLFDLIPDEDLDNDGFVYCPPDNDGYASFECKYLKFVVTLDLDESEVSRAIIESELIPYDQNKIFEERERLDSCFVDWFDKMIFTGKKFKMSELYKKLKKYEKTNGLPFKLIYSDKDQCFEIVLSTGRRITFFDNRIEVSFRGVEPLNILLESLKEVSNTLLQIDNSTKLLD